MLRALQEATRIVETWCQEHPKGFPPIVINITDGEATDGDLSPRRVINGVSCDDGSVLLLNIHLSSTAGPIDRITGHASKLPDQHAKQLFEASSTLTPFMVARAKELGMRPRTTREFHLQRATVARHPFSRYRHAGRRMCIALSTIAVGTSCGEARRGGQRVRHKDLLLPKVGQ